MKDMETSNVISWLEKLPSPYKEAALKNYRLFPQKAGRSILNVGHAVEWFRWGKTPEGPDFWADVACFFDPQRGYPEDMKLPNFKEQ